MANPNDDIPSLTLEVLKDIRGDIRTLKSDMHEMKTDMHEMKSDMHEMKLEVRTLNGRVAAIESEIHTLNGRFDHFLDIAGETNRDLTRRVSALEHHVYGTGAGQR